MITSSWHPLLSALLVLAFYSLALWRIVKSNQGNKVIECGSIALALLFFLSYLSKMKAPDWVLESLGILLLLLSFLTLGLFLREGYRAIRQRK